jgi:very-short-patch-repair endonuclease
LLNSNIVEFINVSTEVHGGKYIYSASTYTGCDNKIIITCPIHGDFEQKAYAHKQGGGCSICMDSTGEREIRKFLNKQEINFVSQKKFDDCRNVFPLRFDFYLPDQNLCIEFDGEQHFKKMGYDKDGSVLKRVQINDQIKNKYCKQNNINLLRINYKDNIQQCLKKSL